MNIFTQKLTSIMTWSEFVIKIEDGLFGERYSDVDLANKIGSSREVIYKLIIGGEKGTQEPRSTTISKFEKAFNIKINTGQELDTRGNTFLWAYSLTKTKLLKHTKMHLRNIMVTKLFFK